MLGLVVNICLNTANIFDVCVCLKKLSTECIHVVWKRNVFSWTLIIIYI